MVEIIREKTRQYAADQSSAIRTQQVAETLSEWRDMVPRATKAVASVVGAFNNQAIEADENMINTQIGSRAQTDLLKWNVEQIEAGVNPNSDEYTQKLYAKKDELYQPYLEQMQSEKGRAYLQKQGLDTAEKIRQSNIGKIAKNRQKAQAQVAYQDVKNNMQNDAKEFGRLGDWEGFKEATAEDKKALVKYGKANNVPGGSEFDIDMANLTNYMAGRAEVEPEEVMAIFDDKESLRKIIYDKLEKADPTMSEKSKELAFEAWYKDFSANPDKRLQDFLSDEVIKQTSDAFVRQAKGQQVAIQQEMNSLPKNSKARKVLEKKYNDLQTLIDDPDKTVTDALTSDLKKAVLPIAKEQYEKNKLQAEKMEEQNAVDFYTMVVNPDTSVSFPAQMAAALGNRPAVEHLFQQSVSDEEMSKAYDAFAQAKGEVLTREYATFEATQGTADKMYDFLSTVSDNPIVTIKDGLELLTEMHKADLTQDQWNDLDNIMYGVFKDRVFADLASSVLESNNRYFPDLSWLTNTFVRVPEADKEAYGLPSTDIRATDKDSVKKFLDSESVRISKDTMAMLGQVAQMPTAEARAQGINDVANFVATEKKKVYDKAMLNYGIDLAGLREQKRNFGQAFTQIGGSTVEYMGDDPYSNEPNFRPVVNSQVVNEARKRIMDGINAIKGWNNESGRKSDNK